MTPGSTPPQGAPPELSVIVPAFNEANVIASSLEAISQFLIEREIDHEIIVVSDGSTDATRSEAHAAGLPHTRVVEYQRNMGKGYALQTGSRLARGEWIAWFDADLDLGPDALSRFLEVARGEDLHVVVGSKRHPRSKVDYPRKRRIYSWMYQQLVRAMFHLQVRDTQVGVKLFRRDVMQATLPVVLVKRYAFDLEILSVSHHFGFDRIVEQPVTLHYRFSGSGMNWRAIANALVDTAAIFYRLRLVRFYDQRRRLVQEAAAFAEAPLPSISIATDPRHPPRPPSHDEVEEGLEAPGAAVLEVPADPTCGDPVEWLRHVADAAQTDVVAIVDRDMLVGPRWAQSALELMRDPSVAAVVGPTIPRLTGDARQDAASVVAESRFGFGPARARHSVGGLREVDGFPTRNVFVRTQMLQSALEGHLANVDDLCRVIRGQGGRVLCSPETVAHVSGLSPLFAPMAREVFRRGRLRSQDHRIRPPYLAPAALSGLVGGAFLAALTGRMRLARRLAMPLAGYAVVVAAFSAVIGTLHRSLRLGTMSGAGAATSHLAFGAGIITGLVRRAFVGCDAKVGEEPPPSTARVVVADPPAQQPHR